MLSNWLICISESQNCKKKQVLWTSKRHYLYGLDHFSLSFENHWSSVSKIARTIKIWMHTNSSRTSYEGLLLFTDNATGPLSCLKPRPHLYGVITFDAFKIVIGCSIFTKTSNTCMSAKLRISLAMQMLSLFFSLILTRFLRNLFIKKLGPSIRYLPVYN